MLEEHICYLVIDRYTYIHHVKDESKETLYDLHIPV